MIGVFNKRRVPQIKIISRKMTHKFFNRVNIEFIKVLFALFRNELQRSKVHNNLKIREDAPVSPSVFRFVIPKKPYNNILADRRNGSPRRSRDTVWKFCLQALRLPLPLRLRRNRG